MQPGAACLALAKHAVPPHTVVLAGGDIGSRARVVEALRAAAHLDRAAGGLTLLSGDEIEMEHVRAALGSLGLWGTGPRVIHVRRAEALFQRGGGARPKTKIPVKSAKAKTPAALAAATEPAVPAGDADAVLLWETDLAPHVHEPQWAVRAIAELSAADPQALLVDCSFPGGEKGKAHIEESALRHGVRLSRAAVIRLAEVAAADPAELDRTLTAVALFAGQAEASADDVDLVRRAARADSGLLVRAWSNAVQAGDGATALRLWAEAGQERGDPVPLLAFLVGGLLASLDGGGFGGRPAIAPAAARACLADARRLDDMLKSSVGDRDTLGALLLAHLSGMGPHLTNDVGASR